MACRLFGAKPWSEPMLYYCQLEPQEQTSLKLYLKFEHFHSRKCVWKCCLENVGHFVSNNLSKPLQPSDSNWHHRTWSSVIQVITYYLFSTEPLLEQLIINWTHFHNLTMQSNFFKNPCNRYPIAAQWEQEFITWNRLWIQERHNMLHGTDFELKKRHPISRGFLSSKSVPCKTLIIALLYS